MVRILSMNEYLDKNPNATLKDYVDYNENIRNAQHTRKKIIEDNFNNWLKEQEGKWFFINFNDSSYLLCQYTGKDMYDRKSILSIEFLRETARPKTYKVQTTLDRKINYLWLNGLNPYSDEYLGVYQQKSGCRWAKEVSDEFVNRIFERFNTTVSTFVDEVIDETAKIEF